MITLFTEFFSTLLVLIKNTQLIHFQYIIINSLIDFPFDSRKNPKKEK